MKIIIGGERLWWVRGLVIQKKNVIWGCYLIEFGEFPLKKGIYLPPFENNYTLESIYYT